MYNPFRLILIAVCTIIIVFIGLAFTALLTSMLVPNFHSIIIFIASFAIGGVLASALSFEYGITFSGGRNSQSKLILVIVQIIIGLAGFFILSGIQQGEYEIPFKSFGVALALGSLLHLKN